MNTRPILFSAEMVRAILDGRKSQTRRVIKPQPDKRPAEYMRWYPNVNSKNRLHYASEGHMRKGLPIDFCPYGQPGDRLWVRESWALDTEYDRLPGSKIPKFGQDRIWYLADGPKPGLAGRTRSSRFMPRWASRITLEIVNIRVERVQEITYHDCIAEGMIDVPRLEKRISIPGERPIEQYQLLWDSINIKRGYGWFVNPWVWVIEFAPLRRVSTGASPQIQEQDLGGRK